MMTTIYLGEQYARTAAANRKPLVEIEVLRDVKNDDGEAIGRQRVKRRGILNRANGQTFWLGVWCYHVDEVLSAHEVLN